MLVYIPQIDWVFSADEQGFQGHFFSISVKNDLCFDGVAFVLSITFGSMFFLFLSFLFLRKKEKEREREYLLYSIVKFERPWLNFYVPCDPGTQI